MNVINDIGSPQCDREGRTITLEYENYYLIASYVPNAGRMLDRLEYRTKVWDPKFQEFINNLNKHKPVQISYFKSFRLFYVEI